MKQVSFTENFFNKDFESTQTHKHQLFENGYLDVKLKSSKPDTRLFIFTPADFPYMWIKYIEGMEGGYAAENINLAHDINTLKNPSSASLAVLVIINGEIVAGLRLHDSLITAGYDAIADRRRSR